ncbi:hypothetical protein GGP41_004789 [Bipolaris sorokiniana]|uniref:Uncharacterized protein n=1 Tax=Cochliobolus sativus TaxID=45130 RepID=A0A8H5ZAQ0_COCSA|nr:hypothetical protein GGP41_004789 [Bipolaris sorokiniana]
MNASSRASPASASWRWKHAELFPAGVLSSFTSTSKTSTGRAHNKRTGMAGRILPIALAAIMGVSIGVATFDGEFKKQRLARMNEEYQRELAAAAASSGVNSSPAQPQLQAKEKTIASQPPDNSWSNMLGLWAWKKEANKEVVPAKENIEEAKGKP